MLSTKAKTLAALTFAGACLSAAHAAPAPADVVTNKTITFEENSSDFGATFGLLNGKTGYSFLSKFNFALTGSSDLDSAFVSVAGKKTDLSFSAFDLYTQAGKLVTTGQGGAVDKITDVWKISFADLAAGAYTLAVAGKVVGVSGGSFGGNVSVSPVPEPATWSMMVGGFGVLALVARRRKTTAEPNFSIA
jgi:hypothetical protein